MAVHEAGAMVRYVENLCIVDIQLDCVNRIFEGCPLRIDQKRRPSMNILLMARGPCGIIRPEDPGL
jgi:hypothetical protein